MIGSGSPILQHMQGSVGEATKLQVHFEGTLYKYRSEQGYLYNYRRLGAYHRSLQRGYLRGHEAKERPDTEVLWCSR